MRTFTIEQIREWLNGKRRMRWNGRGWAEVSDVNNALNSAIAELEDEEDGLAAVTDSSHPTTEGEE